MILKVIAVGEMQANCYIIGSAESGEAMIIDPGGDYLKIRNLLEENGLEAKLIVNTHGHIDHIGANDKFGIPIYIHELDADYLLNPRKNLSEFLGEPYTSPPASRLLKEGDKIKIGELSFSVIHIPGHTVGGICLKTGDVIFTGDTLFCGGIGRTDFPGSSEKDLVNSLNEKILVLPDEMIVYPGHGLPTTIGKERKGNPFLVKSL